MFKQTKQRPSGYMQQLDQWVDEQVINPLFEICEMQERVADDEGVKAVAQEVEQIKAEVRKVIREKILESYHNGQAAGPRPVRQGTERRRYASR